MIDSPTFGYSLEDFKEEARELLNKAESVLTGMKETDNCLDGVNALFRAIHSLKGSAAYSGLKDVHSFAHLYESFLGELRNEKLAVNIKIITILVRAKDYLEDLIFSPESVPFNMQADSSGNFMENLQTILRVKENKLLSNKQPLTTELTHPENKQNKVIMTNRNPLEMGQSEVIKVSVIRGLKSLALSLKKKPFHQNSAMKEVQKLEDSLIWAFGENMSEIIKRIKDIENSISLKAGSHIKTGLQENFNTLAQTIKEKLYSLDGHSDIQASSDKKVKKKLSAAEMKKVSGNDIVKISLEQALDNLSELSEIKQPAEADINKAVERLRNLNIWAFNDNEKVETSLASLIKQLTSPSNNALSAKVQDTYMEVSSIFSTLTGEKTGEPPAVPGRKGIAEKSKNLSIMPAHSSASPTLRVRAEDIETLMNTVGSLNGIEVKDLEKLQNQALQLRMVQVGELFAPFPKVVRDLSERLGKKIELQMSGEAVKLDKTLVDKIREPLLHIVRNAASHGLENQAEIERSGKKQNLIKLNAFHEGGQVIIEVSDNGRGLSLNKIKEKGLALGLLKPEESRDKKKLIDLIFSPGFSTSDKADSISGRGVGLDVVKEVLASLQGTVTLETKEGEGTTFRLILPLTLAIVKALILDESGNQIALPSSSVDKIITLTNDEINKSSFMDKNRLSLDLKEEGEAVPLVSFAKFFGVTVKKSKQCIVIVKTDRTNKVALVVDAAIGRRPLTVQPLDRFAGNRYFSSASMVDEKLIMILNVPNLLAA